MELVKLIVFVVTKVRGSEGGREGGGRGRGGEGGREGGRVKETC